MFPQQLDDSQAFNLAAALLDGFDRHYRLLRESGAQAKGRFEQADWHGQLRVLRERIEFYGLRVRETVEQLQTGFAAASVPMAVWQQVKLHYIGLLTNHRQPELAETFFNSVTTKILHRDYFHNDFIFVRPAVSTEYIETSAATPTLRAWYPTSRTTLRAALRDLVLHYELQGEWQDLERDLDAMQSAMQASIGDGPLRANFQLQVLSSLFFRNKCAYVIGRIVNGWTDIPFALPILHSRHGGYVIDAVLLGEDDLLMLFSFARAYFMVDMEVPSAVVQFLRGLMPRKPRSELYSALGLQKQGKTLFLRDFQAHLRHSTDHFRIAPGIKGMVMLVFDLPSYPFVFKLIKDHFPPQKDTTREQVKAKYQLVKQHDRVGRMADTLEFSNVALPLARFSPELIDEIRLHAPSLLEISDRDGDGQQELILKHVYIERRMIPLNLYLQEADAAQLEQAVIEYGNAIKDLVAANIFPGDMLWKNFGVMRHNRVVFYDYDEIEYLTDCNFRRVPPPRHEDDELSGEIWYAVGPKDVFPETFEPFLLGHPGVREAFMRHHADLLDASFWQAHKERIQAGYVHDVFPYPQHKRFIHRRQAGAA